MLEIGMHPQTEVQGGLFINTVSVRNGLKACKR